MRRFINITNHPIERWDEEQLWAAGLHPEQVGTDDEAVGVELGFPAVPSMASTGQVLDMVATTIHQVEFAGRPGEATVHVMGEMTFTVALVCRLQARGYVVVASTTERTVVEDEGGKKTSVFRFIKFRPYAPIADTPLEPFDAMLLRHGVTAEEIATVESLDDKWHR